MAFCAGALVAVLWFTMAGAGGATTGGEAGGPPGGGAPPGPYPASVRVDKVKNQMLRKRIAVVGRLHELQRATVAAEVEGKVLEVPVQEGDPVIAGKTVLARIDGVWAEQNLKSAEADVAAAQATLDQSELDLKYLEQLREAQSAKPKEVDDMRAQVASDRARLSSVVADRDRARREVERLVVLAPFDGTVTRKITEVGQWVAPGDDIVEVISQGQVDAIADVPEDAIDQVRLGDNATVIIDPLGLNVAGEVVAINPNGQNAARTFPIKVRLDDQGGKLKAGMSVTVWLPIGAEAEYLTVPHDAVIYTVDGKHVWVGVPGGEGSPMPSAASVAVRPLFAQDDRVAVEPIQPTESKLLADGTIVVVEGAETLSPGQPLMDVDAPPTKQ
ncbi:MAG: efflux RND transporter periplasmic adaptor subunit [Phycisphaerales bacterium]